MTFKKNNELLTILSKISNEIETPKFAVSLNTNICR